MRTFRWGARCGCELACRGEPGSRRALHGERLAAASTAPGVVTHHGGRRRLSRLASTARGGDMRRHTFLCHCWLRGAVGTSVAAPRPPPSPRASCRRCRAVVSRSPPAFVLGLFAVACPWEAELRASSATRVFPRVARGPLCQRRVALSSLASRALLGAWLSSGLRERCRTSAPAAAHAPSGRWSFRGPRWGGAVGEGGSLGPRSLGPA